MYIVDYLRFCAALQGVPKAQIEKCISKMIDVCGLGEEKHKKIAELSKGYRQRVGLAQAMIHEPEVLILDEPTSGLDPNQIVEIRKLIKNLGEQKTVILSSHILSEVEATCERILIINKGRIVADGTAASLQKSQYQGEVFRVRFSQPIPELESKLLQLTEVARVEILSEETAQCLVYSKPALSSKRAISELCLQLKCHLLHLQDEEKSLEDVFRELTQ